MFLLNYWRKPHETLMSIANSVRINTQNPASLHRLPAELICEICGYLPTAEIFCLMISCTCLWNRRNSIPAFAKVQQLVYAPRLQQPYRYDLVEARFHILRLMEYDKIYGKGIESLCCWACMCAHNKSEFTNPNKRVNLKLSVDKQRTNWSSANRRCKNKRRKIHIGVCYEMSFAELRDLQLCQNDAEESIVKITTGGNFSERVEFNLKTGRLLSWFYLGRIWDLGFRGFDKLCHRANIPICFHWSTYALGNTFRQGMHHPNTTYYCLSCPTEYSVRIIPYGFIELHISRYVGFLASPSSSKTSYPSSPWTKLSYHGNRSRLNYRCQAFADWLERMYNLETGAVFSGRQFEMFKLGRRSNSRRN